MSIPPPIELKAELPKGYTGLYGFHKYWGKKPHELLDFLIKTLTSKNDVVLDPFLGYGTAGRESLLNERKFIGFDINPISFELSRLILKPPCLGPLKEAFIEIEKKVKPPILKSYSIGGSGGCATHYLWRSDDLEKVWSKSDISSKRIENSPERQDYILIDKYSKYKSKYISNPIFYTNGRINADPKMSLNDIFTGRALRNIDLIIASIKKCSPEIQRNMLLCLTAASGQMSKMVFAITGRKKQVNHNTKEKIEVGSWVIGYWRPKLHFEINVWNCFERRVKKLFKALSPEDSLAKVVLHKRLKDVFIRPNGGYLKCTDALKGISKLPDDSIQLVVTDPPHSDRIPYLELSELWNSILGVKSNFEDELVISNAKERNKKTSVYISKLSNVFDEVCRVLAPSGFCVILYNARQIETWDAFRFISSDESSRTLNMKYIGCFPCNYSARSVVQDNRKGSLKTDYTLIFQKTSRIRKNSKIVKILSEIPGWSFAPPACIK